MRPNSGLDKSVGEYIFTIKLHFCCCSDCDFLQVTDPGDYLENSVLAKVWFFWFFFFIFNMLNLGQIIFFRISALWGMKRDPRNLSLADFQDRLSYWFAPM